MKAPAAGAKPPRKRREPPPAATVPEAIASPQPADYLAVLSQSVFQAGLSWALIEAKWPAYRELFADFDPVVVAAMGEADVEAIMADGRVIRTRKKIAATIQNARELLAIQAEPGGIRSYIDGFAGHDEREAALRARFKFLGRLGVYYWLFRTRHPVPLFEVWERSIEGDHPRMRAMVARGRELGTSTEV